MQGSQYPAWRQVADVADDLDGRQEDLKWGRREKRPDMPSHREEPLPVLLRVPLRPE
jgi:hypothetical protein